MAEGNQQSQQSHRSQRRKLEGRNRARSDSVSVENDQMIYPKYKTKARRATAERKKVAERPQPAKPDWETLRPLILAKSDGCYLCGRPLTLETMTTDHVSPCKKGEPKNNDLGNLMPADAMCNFRKGSRRLTGESCKVCGQKYLAKGLPCLRCERLGRDVRVVRTGRFTI